MMTDRPASLTREPSGSYSLQGELGFGSVTAIWREVEQTVDFAANGRLDLAGVQRADSAGVALLLAWTRRARQAGGHVAFSRVPDQIRAIADACGVREILALESSVSDTEQQGLQA